MEYELLLLILDISLVLIVLCLFFKWCMTTWIRISRTTYGFVRLSQTIFMVLSWLVFMSVFAYYLIINPEKDIPILDIFLTIVVGFLGTMMGLFFNSEALNNLRQQYRRRSMVLRNERVRLLKLRRKLSGRNKDL